MIFTGSDYLNYCLLHSEPLANLLISTFEWKTKRRTSITLVWTFWFPCVNMLIMISFNLELKFSYEMSAWICTLKRHSFLPLKTFENWLHLLFMAVFIWFFNWFWLKTSSFAKQTYLVDLIYNVFCHVFSQHFVNGKCHNFLMDFIIAEANFPGSRFCQKIM